MGFTTKPTIEIDVDEPEPFILPEPVEEPVEPPVEPLPELVPA